MPRTAVRPAVSEGAVVTKAVLRAAGLLGISNKALARIVGCEADALAPEIERFGPPFHAVRVTGALFHTQGGLAIDERCRVQRGDGSVFPNLLAAGGAARGVSGPSLAGYLSGNGLLSAVAGGFIAAHTAARQLGSSA